MARILLVEPDYYTRYPPLGLLKLATYFRNMDCQVELVRGCRDIGYKPDSIFVTSLFTYAWKPVHKAVQFYKAKYPWSKITLGGIYASLLPEHAKSSGADTIFEGLFPEVDTCIPAWDLVPEWDGSIIFSTRGCIRHCNFCAVPKIEGKLRAIISSIKPYIYREHTRIIFWDNNILAAKNWSTIFEELLEVKMKVDFNQGLDARLITNTKAHQLAQLKMKYIRLAYDDKSCKTSLEKAIKRLVDAGVRRKKIIAYTLYNFQDDPEDFRERVTDLLNWGVVSYPMRFEPVTSLKKNSFVSKNWTNDQLEMVAKARRVLGFAGALPPYKGLIQKFQQADNFNEAFVLREPTGKSTRKSTRWAGGLDWRGQISKEHHTKASSV